MAVSNRPDIGDYYLTEKTRRKFLDSSKVKAKIYAAKDYTDSMNKVDVWDYNYNRARICAMAWSWYHYFYCFVINKAVLAAYSLHVLLVEFLQVMGEDVKVYSRDEFRLRLAKAMLEFDGTGPYPGADAQTSQARSRASQKRKAEQNRREFDESHVHEPDFDDQTSKSKSRKRHKRKQGSEPGVDGTAEKDIKRRWFDKSKRKGIPPRDPRIFDCCDHEPIKILKEHKVKAFVTAHCCCPRFDRRNLVCEHDNPRRTYTYKSAPTICVFCSKKSCDHCCFKCMKPLHFRKPGHAGIDWPCFRAYHDKQRHEASWACAPHGSGSTFKIPKEVAQVATFTKSLKTRESTSSVNSTVSVNTNQSTNTVKSTSSGTVAALESPISPSTRSLRSPKRSFNQSRGTGTQPHIQPPNFQPPNVLPPNFQPLVGLYIKVEDMSGSYRPTITQISNRSSVLPIFNINSVSGRCPFLPLKLARAESTSLFVDSSPPPSPVRMPPYYTVTKRNHDQAQGYCGNCKKFYRCGLENHCNGQTHQTYAKDDRNFVKTDQLTIKHDLDLDTFLASLPLDI
eukprot:m.83406 g.83406  ORF g.83406 m.83406 type:complete len:565 (-) comp25630_c0_seq3:100-1794(-)